MRQETKGWNVTDGGAFYPARINTETLPACVYRANIDDDGRPFLSAMPFETDELVSLPDDVSSRVLNEIELFHARRDRFVKRGLIHQRGVLLHGVPGGGKSASVNLLSEMFVTQLTGVVLYMGTNPWPAVRCLQAIRAVEPERKILCAIEDIDELYHEGGAETLLALLNGEHQVDGVVYVATTNFLARLDSRLLRPSRFDLIEEVGMPTSAARASYLRHKEPTLNAAEIEEHVGATEGMSLAQVRELIVLTQCLGLTMSDAVKRLRRLADLPAHGIESKQQAQQAARMCLPSPYPEKALRDVRSAFAGANSASAATAQQSR